MLCPVCKYNAIQYKVGIKNRTCLRVWRREEFTLLSQILMCFREVTNYKVCERCWDGASIPCRIRSVFLEIYDVCLCRRGKLILLSFHSCLLTHKRNSCCENADMLSYLKKHIVQLLLKSWLNKTLKWLIKSGLLADFNAHFFSWYKTNRVETDGRWFIW